MKSTAPTRVMRTASQESDALPSGASFAERARARKLSKAIAEMPALTNPRLVPAERPVCQRTGKRRFPSEICRAGSRLKGPYPPLQQPPTRKFVARDRPELSQGV